MEKWQIQMVNSITTTHKSYDKKYATRIAKEWAQTDEKFSFILNTFVMSANDARVDYWVDRIEDELEKTLAQPAKTEEEELEDNWLRLCGE